MPAFVGVRVGPSIGRCLEVPASGTTDDSGAPGATDCLTKESGVGRQRLRALAWMQMTEELLGGGAPGEETGASQRVRPIELQCIEAGGAQVFVQHARLRRADDVARPGHWIGADGQSTADDSATSEV